MALPASGAISLFDVNDELGLSHSAQIGLLCTNVRTLFAVASGAVGMTTGYGKSNTSVPGAPTIGTATATGATTATVAFTAPGSNGGLTITSYTAVSSPGGITGTLSQAGSGTITVSGLSGATSYTFTVYATNSKGNSSSSSSSNSITTTPVIGQSYQGGFYAGQISTAGNGTADYNLVVGPVSSAQSTLQFATSYTSDPGALSVIDGPANSTWMNNATHPAAQFSKGLTIGGYTDWYMPAKNEIEVCYFNLKPSTASNNPYGINANSVPARASNYTSGNPQQTSASAFITSTGAQAFSVDWYWSSTQASIGYTWSGFFGNGAQGQLAKPGSYLVRAVRRVAV